MPQPTEELQNAIQFLHAAIAMEPDAEDKANLSQCLAKIMQVQKKNMAQSGPQGAPPGGAPPGMGGGSPPAGPQTPADPAALMQMLGQ